MAAIVPPSRPHPQVTRLTYGANDLLQNEAVLKRISDAIYNESEFELTDQNLGIPSNNTVMTCMVVYNYPGGLTQARSAEHGKTFDFSNSIVKLVFGGKEIKSPEPCMKILNLMDSAEGIQVNHSLFGREAATADAYVDIEYYYHGKYQHSQVTSGDYFKFPIHTEPISVSTAASRPSLGTSEPSLVPEITPTPTPDRIPPPANPGQSDVERQDAGESGATKADTPPQEPCPEQRSMWYLVLQVVSHLVALASLVNGFRVKRK